MEDYKQAVFISYARGGECEEIVSHINEALQTRGIQIIRDKQALAHKGSISGFTERLTKENCRIVTISDKNPRSPKCIFELIEIAENKQSHDRIFPIDMADADIYDPLKRFEDVRYWEARRAKLAETIQKEISQGAADTGQFIKATSGSIGFGSLINGGNTSGNIVIGNNNEINSGEED